MSSFRRLAFLKATLVIGLVVSCRFAISEASAVILLNDGNPATNTTAPTGNLAGSGWQFEGTFGPFLGTPIAPKFFVTAKHVSGADSTFYFNGVPYPITHQYNDAFTDLTIFQVSGTFPSIAPLYTSGAETGQHLVVIGRGTQRGEEINLNGTLRGWNWGPGDGVQRWGENIVSEIVHGGPANAYVNATFDQIGLPNECHLSAGDSGGAIFIQEAGVWKLAAINYAVDDLYTNAQGNGQFTAAVFDARGFFTQDPTNPSNYIEITGAQPQPTGFYSTQISSKLAFIYNVIAPSGDVNGNGIPNHLDYGRILNSSEVGGPGAIVATKENGALVFTYWKLTSFGDLQYSIQKSTSLVAWSPAGATETVLFSVDDVTFVRASVPMTGPRMFLRILITQFVPARATSVRDAGRNPAAP